MQRTTVLLVDDTLDQLDLYEAVLAEHYTILKATRGETAYAMAVAKHPDIIVSDVWMPGLDGWTLCQQLKHTPQTTAIPVVLLTADDDDDLSAHGRRVGAAAVLRKPCSGGCLSDVIRYALSDRFDVPSRSSRRPGDTHA